MANKGTSDDYKETDQIVNSFFEIYRSSGSSIALDSLFKQNSGNATIQYQNLKDSLSSIEKVSGEFEGDELITKKEVGKSLVLYSYLVKYQYRPFRFLLMFYKGDRNWIIYKFKFDTEVEDELEQSAKVYFLYK